jgi:hypothetical protein
MNSDLSVLPVKKPEEKPDNLNPILPSHPFLMMLCAPPKAGKSNLVANLLANPNFYYNGPPDNPSYFHEIYYLSPTSKFDLTTKLYLSKLDNVIQIDEPADLENADVILAEILQRQKEWTEDSGEERKKVLVVLDDCVGIMDKIKSLPNIVTRYRHYFTSIIVTTQSYKRVPLTIRNCITTLIFFNLMSQKEFIKLYEEHGQAIPNYWEYLGLLDKRFQFLYYHLERQEVFYNFQQMLWSKDTYLDGKDPLKELGLGGSESDESDE